MKNHYPIKILNLKKKNRKKKNSDGHENYDGKPLYLEKYGKTLMMKNHNNREINHSKLSKWLLLIVLTTVAWFPMSSFALSCDSVARTPKYAQFLAKIARQLGNVTCEKAESFIDYVDGFSRNIQNNFEQIASDETLKYRKEGLVKDTVDKYFDSPRSTVQTSSLNNPGLIRNHAVKRYLTNLAKLSETKYVKVRLEYDKDYFSMGNIEYESEDGRKVYSFKVNMWAMFVGCTDSGRCYRDHTKKGFYIKLQTNRMRVDFVSVEDTVTEEDYRKLQSRWTRE